MTSNNDNLGYPVRADSDDAVHRADVGPEALVDPAGGRTVCGQRVMEVYNDGRGVTCPGCTDDG